MASGTVAAEDRDVCENCDRVIGRLETPHVYQGSVVCADGDDRLRRSSNVEHGQPPGPPPPVPPPFPPPLQYASPQLNKPSVDPMFVVRLLCLIGGLVFWPLLIVWAILGVIYLVNKR